MQEIVLPNQCLYKLALQGDSSHFIKFLVDLNLIKHKIDALKAIATTSNEVFQKDAMLLYLSKSTTVTRQEFEMSLQLFEEESATVVMDLLMQYLQQFWLNSAVKKSIAQEIATVMKRVMNKKSAKDKTYLAALVIKHKLKMLHLDV